MFDTREVLALLLLLRQKTVQATVCKREVKHKKIPAYLKLKAESKENRVLSRESCPGNAI